MSTLHVENLKGLSSGSNANKIIVPSGQTLTAPGHVIQLVRTQTSSTLAIASGDSYTNVVTCAITPKASSSLLKITTSGVYYSNHTASNVNNRFRLLRDGSGLSDYNGSQDSNTGQYLQYRTSAVNNHIPVPFNFTWVHAPNTTSSTTLAIQAMSHQGAFKFYTGMFLIVEEIAQ